MHPYKKHKYSRDATVERIDRDMKTTSLELSKKLKEAGYPYGGLAFYWQSDDIGLTITPRVLLRSQNVHYPAPTAEEILEQLTGRINIDRFLNGKYSVSWMDANMNEYSKSHRTAKTDTLVEALAKCWLYLKENNLLTDSKQDTGV